MIRFVRPICDARVLVRLWVGGWGGETGLCEECFAAGGGGGENDAFVAEEGEGGEVKRRAGDGAGGRGTVIGGGGFGGKCGGGGEEGVLVGRHGGGGSGGGDNWAALENGELKWEALVYLQRRFGCRGFCEILVTLQLAAVM